MIEKVRFLIRTRYHITRHGVNLINEKNKEEPYVFFLNQYFWFSPCPSFKEIKTRIMRTLRSRAAMKFGKGCKIVLFADIERRRQHPSRDRLIRKQPSLF